MPSNLEMEIVERLARIETLLKPIATHENRIRALERWRSWSTGIVVGGAAILGLVWKLAGH